MAKHVYGALPENDPAVSQQAEGEGQRRSRNRRMIVFLASFTVLFLALASLVTIRFKEDAALLEPLSLRRRQHFKDKYSHLTQREVLDNLVLDDSRSVRPHIGEMIEFGSAAGNQSKSEAISASALRAHNKRREAWGLEPFVWDGAIAAFAETWVHYLATENNCLMQHSAWSIRSTVEYPEGKGIGENLVWKSGGHLTWEQAVHAWWHDELTLYFYGPSGDPCTKQIQTAQVGHFTQCAWASSKYLGCAQASCPNGNIVGACNYGPAGNWAGQVPFPQTIAEKFSIPLMSQNVMCHLTPPATPASGASDTPAPTSPVVPSGIPCFTLDNCVLVTNNCDKRTIKIGFKCHKPKQGGLWAQFSQYSHIDATMTLPNNFTEDLSRNCEVCSHPQRLKKL